MTIRIRRIYEGVEGTDGYRVLVDRLWPRGVSKQRAQIDVWLKEVGPSNELRTWFHHDPQLWDEFRQRYLTELGSNDALGELREIVGAHDVVTLLYGARDEKRNQAVVLAEYLA